LERGKEEDGKELQPIQMGKKGRNTAKTREGNMKTGVINQEHDTNKY
jgi:hypothetical protein